MKKLSLIILSMFIGLTIFSQDVTVDEVVSKYLLAKGEKNLAAVNSLKMEGSVVRNDFMPVCYYRTRPNKYMMKFDVADLTAYRAFDGENAWYTAPWRSIINPTLLPDDQAMDLKNTADFNDPLSTWKEKKHKLNLLPDTTLEGSPHFVLELVNSITSLPTIYYIDKETNLLTKVKIERGSGEKTYVQETFYSDYREVSGIMFPFLVEVFANGYKSSSTEFDEITLNVELEDDFYSMDRYTEK